MLKTIKKAIEKLFKFFHSYYTKRTNESQQGSSTDHETASLRSKIQDNIITPILKMMNTIKETFINTSNDAYYLVYDYYIYYWRQHMTQIRRGLMCEVGAICLKIHTKKHEENLQYQLSFSSTLNRLAQHQHARVIDPSISTAQHSPATKNTTMTEIDELKETLETQAIQVNSQFDDTSRVFKTTHLHPLVITPDSLSELCCDDLMTIIQAFNNNQTGKTTVPLRRGKIIDNNYAKHTIEGRDIEFSNFQTQTFISSCTPKYMSLPDFILKTKQFINHLKELISAIERTCDDTSSLDPACMTAMENLRAAEGYANDTIRQLHETNRSTKTVR